MTSLEQMFQMFQQMHTNNKSNELVAMSLKVAKKLKYHNYITWSRMIHIEIKSRGMLDYLTTTHSSTFDEPIL